MENKGNIQRSMNIYEPSSLKSIERNKTGGV